MFVGSHSLQVQTLILLVELPVWLEGIRILIRRIEGGRNRLSDVLHQTVEVLVIVKHGAQTGTLPTSLVLKLVVNNRSCEGVKVCVGDEVVDAEHALLEALHDLSQSVLELLLVRLEEELVGLEHKLGDVERG